jgi:hypothetical protein
VFLRRLPLQETQLLESTVLQLADVFNFQATNKLRSKIASLVFCKHNEKIQQMLPQSSKEIFLKRIEDNLVSNDPQARALALKVLSALPSFLITRLNVQHLILHILTTTTDQQERSVATRTIQLVSSSSDLFAKSIMSQIEVRILSDHNYFSLETC